MSDDITYKLSIVGDGFSLEQKITEIQKGKIVSFLNLPVDLITSTDSEQSANAPIHQVSAVSVPAKSIVEFILEKKPITNSQKIAVFFLYSEDVLLLPNVTKEEIRELFQKARENMPANLSRDFDTCIKLGWISLTGSAEGRYYLTTTGRSAIASGFRDDVSNSQKRSTSRKSGKKTPLMISSEVENLSLQQDAPRFKSYWELNKGERVLWLTAQAQEQGISELNLKEVSRLAEKMRDDIQLKNIPSLIDLHSKADRISATRTSNNTLVLRILKKGLDHLSNTENYIEEKNAG